VKVGARIEIEGVRLESSHDALGIGKTEPHQQIPRERRGERGHASTVTAMRSLSTLSFRGVPANLGT